MSIPIIELPYLNWFKGDLDKKTEVVKGNTYTGSIGTDPQRGCVSIYTADYKAFFYKDETGLHLTASWRVRPPWNKPQDTETIEKVFDGSADGIQEAERWLSSEIQRTIQ